MYRTGLSSEMFRVLYFVLDPPFLWLNLRRYLECGDLNIFVLELMWHFGHLYSLPVVGSNVVLVASDVMEKIHMLSTCELV